MAVDHIYHIVDIADWDHVGIGGGFDGIPFVPKGISSVADLNSSRLWWLAALQMSR